MYLKVIKKNKERFEKYNEIKLERFQQLVGNEAIWRVLSSIPYLLSVNDSKMPGYVEGEVPLGVANYDLDEATRRFLRGKFHRNKIEIRTKNRFVQMLAVMGSVGTIAYNKKSDFDYWICINKYTITPDMYANFRKKVERIQKWAEREINRSVHLFINDIENIKQNIFDEDEDEAFGSTTGALLKDEFYRSSIIIAGKIPFWWVVPQFAQDTEFGELYKRLPEEMKEHEFLDLGNLYRISKEDFLGAALFQIIKSLGNPFKSIIKLGVLEKYIFESEEAPLISQKVKIHIHRNNISNHILDSYLMMFREVFEYYSTTLKDATATTILCQNLYLKINPQLSKYKTFKNRKNIPYKVAEMFRSVKEWNWNMDQIKELDDFDNWEFNKVVRFWENVQTFMLKSYQKIATQLPTLNIKNKISESDFKLISRKIKSHYSKKPGKIDKYVTFKDTSSESLLYIEPIHQGVREVDWRLYKRRTGDQNNLSTTTIKTDKSLINLIVWTVLNRIYDPKFSRLTLQSGYTRINQNIVIDFMNKLSTFFTEEKMQIKNRYILRSVFNLLNFIDLNFNLEKSDKIEKIRHIYHTSWGESFIQEYSVIEGLSTVLVRIIKDGAILKKGFDEFCAISSPAPYKKLYKDVYQLFKTAYTTIIENRGEAPARFVTRVGSTYLVFTRDKKSIDAGHYQNIIRLFTALTLKPRPLLKYTFFDYDDPNLQSCNYIAQQHKEKTISISYEQKGNFIFAYVINEVGNFFVFYRPKEQEESFLAHLYGFTERTIQHVKDHNSFSPLTKESIKVYMMTTDAYGKMSRKDITTETVHTFQTYYSLRETYSVYISRIMGDEPFYNLHLKNCDESGFLTIQELGTLEGIFAELQRTQVNFCNMITKIEFLDRKEHEELNSTLFFMEKYKIESMVEKFLAPHAR